jgi:hypothetical protein
MKTALSFQQIQNLKSTRSIRLAGGAARRAEGVLAKYEISTIGVLATLFECNEA